MEGTYMKGRSHLQFAKAGKKKEERTGERLTLRGETSLLCDIIKSVYRAGYNTTRLGLR